MRRWTMIDLKQESDRELIAGFLRDRRQSCTNYYSPLYEKLTEIIAKLDQGHTFDEDGNLVRRW